MKPNAFNASRRALFRGNTDFIVYRDPVDTGSSVEGSGRQANAVEENDVNKKIDNKQLGPVGRIAKELDDFEAGLLQHFVEQAHLEAQRLAKEKEEGTLMFQRRESQLQAQVEYDASKRQRKLTKLLKECNKNQRKLNKAYRQYQVDQEEKVAALNQEVLYHQGVSCDLEYQKQLWEYFVLKMQEILAQQGEQERLFEAWQDELSGWWNREVVAINTEDFGLGRPMDIDDEAFKAIDYPMLLD